MATSDTLGRAFEYICITCLKEEISKVRPARLVENSSYLRDKFEWGNLDSSMQEVMRKEALAAIPTIMDIEPMIEENSGDILTLRLQSDQEGIAGDVRDILLTRDKKGWVLGISVKHNHFAVKHSRLSRVLDFGKSWYGVPCSRAYWDDIKPIFAPLAKVKGKVAWRDLEDKESLVYTPLLEAFINEVKRAYEKDNSIPAKMVEYLLGEYDFYKVVGVDRACKTDVIAFNLHGTLNQSSKNTKPKRKIPRTLLPTRIVSIEIKPHSNTTVELYLDNGWQFSLRIHNASSMVEPSLKFDINIVGLPTTIVTINCPWL